MRQASTGHRLEPIGGLRSRDGHPVRKLAGRDHRRSGLRENRRAGRTISPARCRRSCNSKNKTPAGELSAGVRSAMLPSPAGSLRPQADHITKVVDH